MSNYAINNALTEFQNMYLDDVKAIGEGTQQALLVVPTRLLDVLGLLKSHEAYQFDMLRNLTAVDYPEYLEIVYHLYSLPLRHSITIKTRCSIEDAKVPSVTAIWPSANFQEREVYDLLGVSFTGHPDLRRILLPEEFPGHPLRKAYKMGNTGEKR